MTEKPSETAARLTNEAAKELGFSQNWEPKDFEPPKWALHLALVKLINTVRKHDPNFPLFVDPVERAAEEYADVRYTRGTVGWTQLKAGFIAGHKAAQKGGEA